jgi:hypothetical protein
MRDSPEYFAPTPHQMPAHMVKSRGATTVFRQATDAWPILWQQWREDFNLIEQSRLP